MGDKRDILWRMISDDLETKITEDDAECIAEQWACEISFDELDVCF